MRLLAPLLLCLGLLAAVPPPAAGAPRLAPALRDALARPVPPGELAVRVVLRGDGLPAAGPARQAAIAARQDAVLGALPAGLRLKHRHRALAGFSATVTPGVLEALRHHPAVAEIHPDRTVHGTLPQGVPQVGADAAHAAGYTGAGIVVAVVDSGVDTDHLDIEDDLVAQQCFCDHHPAAMMGGCCAGGAETAATAEDDNGHGTAVTGIITSDGVVAAVGVAPDAEIVAVKVLDATATGELSDVDAALDWILANQGTLGVDIVNLSLGDSGEYDSPLLAPCTDPTAQAIGALHAAGVAVFAASGNEGHDAGISAPACAAQAISVGGVYDFPIGPVTWCLDSACSAQCTDDARTDGFVCHSNSGALLDLLAPDWRIKAPALGGGTANFGGTSAASPFAAGQAALLLDADPSLTPDAVRALLVGHGPSVTNPDSGLAFPRSDVEAALVTAVSECGNGAVELGEDCDDGNTASGDCCSATCLFEAAGSPCDDADACSDPDTCDGAGACGGPALVCDDADVCTADTCDTATGCLFTPGALDCDDGDACTADACDAVAGCTHTPIEPCPAAGVPATPAWARLAALLGLVTACLAVLALRARARARGAP